MAYGTYMPVYPAYRLNGNILYLRHRTPCLSGLETRNNRTDFSLRNSCLHRLLPLIGHSTVFRLPQKSTTFKVI
jgi:hypothetical protein